MYQHPPSHLAPAAASAGTVSDHKSNSTTAASEGNQPVHPNTHEANSREFLSKGKFEQACEAWNQMVLCLERTNPNYKLADDNKAQKLGMEILKGAFGSGSFNPLIFQDNFNSQPITVCEATIRLGLAITGNTETHLRTPLIHWRSMKSRILAESEGGRPDDLWAFKRKGAYTQINEEFTDIDVASNFSKMTPEQWRLGERFYTLQINHYRSPADHDGAACQAYYERIKIRIVLGNFEGAIADADAVLNARIDSAKAYTYKVLIYCYQAAAAIKENRFEDAHQALLQAEQILYKNENECNFVGMLKSKIAEGYAALANHHAKQANQMPIAKQYAIDALNLDSKAGVQQIVLTGQDWEIAGDRHAKKGNDERGYRGRLGFVPAVNCYEQASQLGVDTVEFHMKRMHLCIVHELSGGVDAWKRMSKVISRDQKATFTSEQLNLAASLYKANSTDPELGFILTKQRQFDQAFSLYRRLIWQSSTSLEWYRMKVFEDAMQGVQAIYVDQKTSCPEQLAYMWLGHVYESCDPKFAMTVYRQALIDPKALPATERLWCWVHLKRLESSSQANNATAVTNTTSASGGSATAPVNTTLGTIAILPSATVEKDSKAIPLNLNANPEFGPALKALQSKAQPTVNDRIVTCWLLHIQGDPKTKADAQKLMLEILKSDPATIDPIYHEDLVAMLLHEDFKTLSFSLPGVSTNKLYQEHWYEIISHLGNEKLQANAIVQACLPSMPFGKIFHDGFRVSSPLKNSESVLRRVINMLFNKFEDRYPDRHYCGTQKLADAWSKYFNDNLDVTTKNALQMTAKMEPDTAALLKERFPALEPLLTLKKTGAVAAASPSAAAASAETGSTTGVDCKM